MNIDNVKSIIDEHVDLIAINSTSLQDAKERSGKFLIAQAILASFLKDFEDDKSKLVTLCEANYAKAISAAEGKNVTEKKISVNLDQSYISAREAVEQIETIRTYIKTHMKIFENAHLLYRQYGRD